MTTEPKALFEEEARKLLGARCPLVFVQTQEEERLERILAGLAQKAFSQPVAFGTWSVTEGLVIGTETLPESADPVKALGSLIAYPRAGIFFFRDLHRHYDDARVCRRLRDAYRSLKKTHKALFLCGPVLNTPPETQGEVALLDLLLPGLDEMEKVFREVVQSGKNVVVDLEDGYDDLMRAALGLTEDQARSAFQRLTIGKRPITTASVGALYQEKRDIVRKEGILDFIPVRMSLDDIGGLDVLKAWLVERQQFFSRDAKSFGLDPPKGLLLTGISGCGKSIAVKAVSASWRMPLLRLDINRIYAASAGSPERTLERALQTAEAIAPCVLWIDEIETAIVGTHGNAGGAHTRIFSSFLTWMQEKTAMVFVAATANQIDQLPPELLRKGRFDEVFFVDLPNERERGEIVGVHLKQRNQDATQINFVNIAKSTHDFNGAELEQVVLSAMYMAFGEKRALSQQDLYQALGRMVPLATTMAEQIKQIKRWADRRAVKASTS